MNEKRKHPRLQFGFWIHDKSSKKAWVTEDISVGGCFLEAIENLPVGSKIDLVFELPGSSHFIEAMGEVKHTRDGGMGLKFSNMGYREKDEVDRFVQDILRKDA